MAIATEVETRKFIDEDFINRMAIPTRGSGQNALVAATSYAINKGTFPEIWENSGSVYLVINEGEEDKILFRRSVTMVGLNGYDRTFPDIARGGVNVTLSLIVEALKSEVSPRIKSKFSSSMTYDPSEIVSVLGSEQSRLSAIGAKKQEA